MEKEQIITELITLRRGLSIISKYTDDIKKIKEQENNEKSILDLLESDYQICLKTIESLNNKLEENIKFCNDKEKEIAHLTRIQKDSQAIKNESNRYPSFVRFFPGDEYNDTITMIHFYAALFTSGVYPLFLLPIYWIRKIREKKKNINKTKEKFINEICKAKTTLNDSLKKNEDIKKEIENTIKKAEELNAELERKKEEEIERKKNNDDNLAVFSVNSQAMYKTLRNTYGTIIDESDWENIDLIIHYIVTGRADTIKEALYQVDRQRQTNQIVQAIEKANKSMCNHIENVLYKFGTALSACFSRLNSNLKNMTKDIISTNNINNSKIVQKLDLQISETKMNAILLEKSNQTSKELLNDLRYNQKLWVK